MSCLEFEQIGERLDVRVLDADVFVDEGFRAGATGGGVGTWLSPLRFGVHGFEGHEALAFRARRECRTQ